MSQQDIDQAAIENSERHLEQIRAKTVDLLGTLMAMQGVPHDRRLQEAHAITSEDVWAGMDSQPIDDFKQFCVEFGYRRQAAQAEELAQLIDDYVAP